MTAKSIASDSGRLSVNALARREGVHSATVWRWLLHGVRGHKLHTVRVGGRRFVKEADWQVFSNAINADLIDAQAASHCVSGQEVASVIDSIKEVIKRRFRQAGRVTKRRSAAH